MTGTDDRDRRDDDGSTPVDLDSLSGAYVLDALTDDERAAFEAHLVDHPELTEEVAGLAETTLLLAHAAQPVTPSAGLRDSLMASIATMPQLPVTADPAPQAAHRAEERVPATPDELDEGPGGVVLAPTGAARARWATRPVVWLGAAAAAAGLFFAGGAVVGSFPGADVQQEQQASGIESIYAADDFQRAVTDVSTGGTATLVWSNELQRSAVVLDGVTSLPGDQTYELWYINEGGATPAGTVDATGTGPVTKVLHGELQAGDTIGITVEPAGGSESPTTDPIAAIQSA